MARNSDVLGAISALFARIESGYSKAQGMSSDSPLHRHSRTSGVKGVDNDARTPALVKAWVDSS